MGSTLGGVLFVLGGVALALAGMAIARRSLSVKYLESHHETAGFLIGVVGVVYAVLLAFVVVIVWEEYSETVHDVAQEANELGDLWRMADGFRPELKRQVRDDIVAYGTAVIESEWPAMAAGAESDDAWKAMARLWATYVQVEPATERERVLYAESLHSLNELSDDRRTRLGNAEERVPMVLWVALYGGAIITVTFTYLFQLASIRLQIFMTVELVALITITLFLVVALSAPFSGPLRIGPDSFQKQLASMAWGG
jgi:hypothetical protein